MGHRTGRRSGIVRIYRLCRLLFYTWLIPSRILRVRHPDAPAGRARVEVLKRQWALRMLRGMRVELSVHGTALREPCLFVVNHQGFLDVPVLMAAAAGVFIAKSEVRKWLFFGRAASSVGTLYVERASAESRKDVAGAIGRAITEKARSVTIFPEGTSSSHGKPWKKGSFAVAAEFGFRLQPIRIAYNPHRDCCYIDRDRLLPKMWDLLGHARIVADIEYLEPIFVTDVEAAVRACERAVQASHSRKLREWGLTEVPYGD